MMMSPYNFRLGLFICSALTVSLFFGNMITIFIKYLAGTTPTDSFGEVISLYVLVLQFGAFIPASFIFLYDGLALTPYSIFNSQYGHWDDIVLPGQQTRDDDDKKPAAQTDPRPAAQTDPKPAAQTDSKPAAQTDAKPAAQTDAKPAAKTDTKSAAYTEDKTGAKL